MPRSEFDYAKIEEAVGKVREMVLVRLTQKGKAAFISKHEVLGIVAEEYDELVKAVRKNDEKYQRVKITGELLDIAVACILGMACSDDWEW